MWHTQTMTSKSTWKTGAISLGICMLFASGLAAQDQGDRDSSNRPPSAASQRRDADAYGGVPDELTLPVGTTIVGQLSQYLSSHQNQPGDQFTVTLDQPLVVNGFVVARRGQVAHGQVTVANKGGTGKGPSELGIELTELVLVDGQQVPIATQLIDTTGGSNAGRNVSTIATTTVLGTVIGGIIGRGTGAAIGAGAGATAGAIAVLHTSGSPTVLPPETPLTFRLGAPTTFSTEGSARAFLPVSPQDYGNGGTQVRYSRPGPGPYARPYPPYPYPYPYAYAYPYPYYYGPTVAIVGRFGGPRGFGRRW